MTNLSGANLNNGAAVGPQCEGRDSPSNFPKYSAYKDSGVEWLGAVPEGWELIPFKYVAEFVNGMAFKPEQWSEVGIPIIRIENLNNGESFNYFEGTVEERYHVKTGDLLFGWSGNRGTSFGPFLWHGVGLHYLNQHIFRIADFRCDKKWLYWALKAVTKTIEDQAHGIIGMVHVTKGKLGGIKIPLLPHPEQTQIARFLDHETARIDALIEEQQRLIELLKEKRQAAISHAVTKGLDPTVPMKDSGVEWLGEVPAHWDVCSLRRVIGAVEQGWSPECEAIPADEDAWGILKAGCVNRGVFNPEENKTLPADLEPISAYEIRAGDILMSRASGSPELVGSTALLGEVRKRLMLSDKIFRIHLEKKVSGSFFVWVMNAQFMRAQIEQALSGGNGLANNLPQSSLLAFWLAVPSRREQEVIAEYINELTARMDELISQGDIAVKFLQERRSALISAAVTGKIDVRGWQPPAGTPSPESAIAEAH